MKMMETKRLIIRHFIPDDWEDLYEYLSNAEVVKYEPYNTFTKEDCIAEAKWRAEDGKDIFWAVCLKDSKKMIGHIYFAKRDPEKFNTWNIGYVFNPNFYGQGFATEACKRILKYAFEEKDVHRIVAGANVKNPASWKLLERLSMRREAHMLKNAYFNKTSDGEPIWNDSYHYAILASEYIKINEEIHTPSM